MSAAQPMPELSLEKAAAAIFDAQLAVKSLCEARDNLTAEIASKYREIEWASYGLRLHLSESGSAKATIGQYDVEAKLDDKKLRVASIAIGSTGEKRIIPTAYTTRIVVRKTKP